MPTTRALALRSLTAWHMTKGTTVNKLAAVIALFALVGCADFEVGFNRPTAAERESSAHEDPRPDWLRDPARGEYPYSPRGW